MNPEQYLEQEEKAAFKREYWNGRVDTMSEAPRQAGLPDKFAGANGLRPW